MASAAQSLSVDYLVSGALDGATPAPVVRRSQPGATRFSPGAQIYEPTEVEDLGTVDPDLGFGGSIGLRFISQLLVDLGSAVGGPGAKVVVAAQRGTDLVELDQVLDLAGVSLALAAPFVVPQGAVLALSGVTAGAEPILVRISIDTPANAALLLATLAVAAAATPLPSGLLFSSSVAVSAGSTQLEKGILQRYDASALADNAMTLTFPATPAVDDRTGIKEVGDSTVVVDLAGNGSGVETPTAAPVPAPTTSLARQSLIWQYDGTDWRLV